jgi:hypothetical protein
VCPARCIRRFSTTLSCSRRLTLPVDDKIVMYCACVWVSLTSVRRCLCSIRRRARSERYGTAGGVNLPGQRSKKDERKSGGPVAAWVLLVLHILWSWWCHGGRDATGQREMGVERATDPGDASNPPHTHPQRPVNVEHPWPLSLAHKKQGLPLTTSRRAAARHTSVQAKPNQTPPHTSHVALHSNEPCGCPTQHQHLVETRWILRR